MQDVETDEAKKLRLQRQTAKARAASLAAKAVRKAAVQGGNDGGEDSGPPTFDTVFQRSFFKPNSTTMWFDEAGSENLEERKNRKRAVWSYLSAFANKLVQLFHPHADAAQQEISHVISTYVLDDTNMTLLSAQFGTNEVRTALNCIQRHLVVRPETMPVWFQFHQPLVFLQTPSAEEIHMHFRAWAIAFCKEVGSRLQFCGVPKHLFARVKWHVVAFVGDALKVNDSVCKKLVKQIHHQPFAGEGPKTVLLQLHCVIHQISLTRKGLALGFTGLWSTLVRLGHLFESHSFRLGFKRAMRKVIGQSFFFLRVDVLPSDSPTWRQARIHSLRLFSDSGHSGGLKSGSASRRLKALLNCKTDNGDPHGKAFCHWCVGSECCSGVPGEALERMVCEYESIFDRLQVPLLYRWKHASQAISFLRDGIFLHNIIPRTLNEMSNMKRKSGI